LFYSHDTMLLDVIPCFSLLAFSCGNLLWLFTFHIIDNVLLVGILSDCCPYFLINRVIAGMLPLGLSFQFAYIFMYLFIFVINVFVCRSMLTCWYKINDYYYMHKIFLHPVVSSFTETLKLLLDLYKNSNKWCSILGDLTL